MNSCSISKKNGLPLPPQGSAYSINRGLWGITIGGQETLTSDNTIPESAWVLSANAFSEPKAMTQHTLEFAGGVPVALDGEALAAGRTDRKTRSHLQAATASAGEFTWAIPCSAPRDASRSRRPRRSR